MKLEVKDLHKSFDGKEVLKGVRFSVESGRALGLLGRNGAGKTTSIRIIMDIFHADEGEVLLDGKPFSPSKNCGSIALGVRQPAGEHTINPTKRKGSSGEAETASPMHDLEPPK